MAVRTAKKPRPWRKAQEPSRPFPRTHARTVQQATGRRNLTAAAVPINLTDHKQLQKMRVLREGWQNEAFQYRHAVPEIRFSFDFLASAAKRMRILPAGYQADGETDTPVPLKEIKDIPLEVVTAAHSALNSLGNGRLALAGMMHKLSTNVSVAGECWLIGQENPNGGEDWKIRSVSEIIVKDDRYSLREVPQDSQGAITWTDLDPDQTVLTRMWVPNPQWDLLADSPMRTLGETCEALQILRRGIRASGRSRLTGAGMLVMPQEIQIMRPIDDNDDDLADDVVGELMDAMATAIAEEGVASADIPIFLQGPGEFLEKIRLISFASGYDKEALEALNYLQGLVAVGVNLPKSVVTGAAEELNHWCADDQTEALTKDRGWVGHTDIRDGDEILTLNHHTGLSEWKPVEAVYRAPVVNEPMIAMEGTGHSSLTTPNHRWPTLHRRYTENVPYDGREWKTTETLDQCDKITTGAPCADLPRDEIVPDDLVALIGWFWTEGNIASRNGGAVSIAQSHTRNPERVDQIRGHLTRLYGPASESRLSLHEPQWREKIQPNESSHGGPITVFYLNAIAAQPIMLAAPGKIVSREFVQSLTAGQLELFIDVSLQGDGQHYRAGATDIWQAESDPLDGFELALILSGRASVRGDSGDGHRVCAWKSPTQRPVKAAMAKQAGGRKGMQITRESYTGTVWCPTTENGTWLARRRGTVYYTGNSAWSVSADTFRHYIEPHVITCCDLLTAGYFRQALIADGVPLEWVDRLLLWYDPVELISAPDKSTAAQALHTAFAISDEAFRRESGFSDEDAPSLAELERRRVQDIRALPLNLLMEYARRADPSLIVPPINVAGTVPGIKPGGVDIGEPAPPAGGHGAPAQIGPGTPPAAPAPVAGKEGPPPQPTSSPNAPAGITASGSRRPTDRELRLSRKLTAIDKDVRARLRVAANVAMRQQLERAGKRVKDAAHGRGSTVTGRNEQAIQALAGGTPDWCATAKVGQALAEQMGLSGHVLAKSEWATLKAQWIAWTGQAQSAAIQTANQIAPADPDQQDQARQQMNTGRDLGWAVLASGMSELAGKLMFNPDPQADTLADVNLDTLVPTGLIRTALAAAGNVAAGTLTEAPSVGQIGTGTTIGNLLTISGAGTHGFEWDHGSPQEEFEPHADLDGVEFDSFASDVLTNPGDWPPVQSFAPGDHDGCTCDVTPLWMSSDDNPEAEDEG